MRLRFTTRETTVRGNSLFSAFFAAALAVLAPPVIAADSGLITKPSNYAVKDTVSRFERAVTAKGQMVFGEIDHAAAAAKYGIAFKPHMTVLFSQPESGTPLMQQAGTLTIDLPQKIAVWEDEQGKVWLTFNSADYLASQIFPRHGISIAPDQSRALQRFLDDVTDEATK
jgi:uncharacterized protein (DUF302 family)